MTLRQKRLALLAGAVALIVAATALVLVAFRENLVFFLTPTQVANREAPTGRVFRIGGLVEEGSVRRDGIEVSFRITDTVHTIPVVYRGILPDLFREGKGVVAQGQIDSTGVFRAKEVLAKHDENYMPPEAASAVERAQQALQRSQQSLK
ncbi:MAG: cytochrome c maturation protein CcmE [Casimicrobiaceae bacterium]|nr:cytochrome c maturation protein CcmE [Casimicrobiaceae bacterium]MCX8097454.1 cytochrome c maturation protein CcmE [Casimicrobiaceae bacterium]MDW8311172.1 cytochrome c maturation protein CcmE [Burkholderiales bacterium]